MEAQEGSPQPKQCVWGEISLFSHPLGFVVRCVVQEGQRSQCWLHILNYTLVLFRFSSPNIHTPKLFIALNHVSCTWGFVPRGRKPKHQMRTICYQSGFFNVFVSPSRDIAVLTLD